MTDATEVEKVDALIDMIISTYHTTRMIETPAALHIRTKLGPRLIEALSTLSRPVEPTDAEVEAGKAAILEDLRDRRLLKWPFAEDPESHGPIGYVEGPIDAETQNECTASLARVCLRAALAQGGKG